MNLPKIIVILTVCGICIGAAIEPLAEDFKVLYRSEDPENIYVGNPGVAVCPNGRIIASFLLRGPDSTEIEKVAEGGRGFVYTSDDDGDSWVYRHNFPLSHARAFAAGQRVYMLGHRGDLGILYSDDWGDTWSDVYDLTDGQAWHASATNVWYKDNFVYLVMERRLPGEMSGGWRISELAPVLLRGDITKDLTKRENWTFSSEMAFKDVVNDKELDWFGVPFQDGFYPEVKRRIGGKGNFPPIGWLEANVVQITDPNHYWFDPQGKTFHIFMRAHTGLTNLACVIKAVEKEDGTIETMFQKAPSGKKHLFIPFPGGQMKFSVVYDQKSKLYWMVGTQSTDSMTKPQFLPDDRFELADNQRSRLVLHFSKNMIDWVFAGVVSIGEAENASRHYPQMVIKDDDLLIMSRSGDLDSYSAHDSNIITFHRVRDFRELVY